MKRSVSIKLQLLMAIVMYLISIYMTISYYELVSTDNVDKLTTIAFYGWIGSIVAWLIKVIHDTMLVMQLNNSHT